MNYIKLILASFSIFQNIFLMGQVEPKCSNYSENCLKFDGVNDYVDFGDVNDLGTNDFTIEAWVYLDGNGSNGSKIINKGLTTNGNPGNAGYGLRLHYGSTDLVQFSLGDASGALATASAIVPGFNGSWHHLAGVREGTIIRLYVDCQLVDSANTSTVFNVDTDIHFSLGAIIKSLSNIGEHADGKIDEVRIWDVARSGQEICRSKGEYFCVLPDNLIAYYHMNENNPNSTNSGSTIVTDFAGINNGFATNFALSGTSSNWVDGYDILDADPSYLNPSIYVSNETLFANDTTYASYQWYDCNQSIDIPGETGTSYDPTYDGSYSLSVSEGCCTASSCCLQIDVQGDFLDVTIEELIKESNIYPNPVVDLVNVTINYNHNDDCRILIYDMSGKIHGSFEVENSGLNTIDLSGLVKGNYLLVVHSRTEYKSYKFVKN